MPPIFQATGLLLGIVLLCFSVHFIRRGWQAHRRPLSELTATVARLETPGRDDPDRYYIYLSTDDHGLARFDVPPFFLDHLQVGDRVAVRFFPGMNWIRELHVQEGYHEGRRLWDASAKSQAPGFWTFATILGLGGISFLILIAR